MPDYFLGFIRMFLRFMAHICTTSELESLIMIQNFFSWKIKNSFKPNNFFLPRIYIHYNYQSIEMEFSIIIHAATKLRI